MSERRGDVAPKLTCTHAREYTAAECHDRLSYGHHRLTKGRLNMKPARVEAGIAALENAGPTVATVGTDALLHNTHALAHCGSATRAINVLPITAEETCRSKRVVQNGAVGIFVEDTIPCADNLRRSRRSLSGRKSSRSGKQNKEQRLGTTSTSKSAIPVASPV